MENQKALVDAGVNNPFSFVTFDRFFSNKQLLLLVEILGGVGEWGVCICVCIVINSQCMMQNFFI